MWENLDKSRRSQVDLLLFGATSFPNARKTVLGVAASCSNQCQFGMGVDAIHLRDLHWLMAAVLVDALSSQSQTSQAEDEKHAEYLHDGQPTDI